jgi:hypothetical protein
MKPARLLSPRQPNRVLKISDDEGRLLRGGLFTSLVMHIRQVVWLASGR